MEQTIKLGNAGWKQEEAELLFSSVRDAAQSGQPLRSVFEKVSSALGRKPNSIRNYYYQQLRAKGETELKRAAPFEPFTQDEVETLMRRVLTARQKGQSVRACVLEMAGGDKSLMLRYQNKYRATLKSHPEMVAQIKADLGMAEEEAQEEADCAQLYTRASHLTGELDDPDVKSLLIGLDALLERALAHPARQEDDLNRVRVAYDLMRMQFTDIQRQQGEVVRPLLTHLEGFLDMEADDREESLPAFCQQLYEDMQKVTPLFAEEE